MIAFFSFLLRRAGHLLLCCLGAVLLAGPVCAQDSTLTRLIRQHQYALAPGSGGQFSGPGWDKIQASIQKSQYVLLGEGHGTAQVPQFAAAVAQVLKPAAYVSEIDPYIAQALTRLTAQPGPPTAYVRQYPDALCFENWDAEFELVRTLRAQQVRLVGLDQVFLATAAPLYQQLAGQVKSKVAQAYFQRCAAIYQAHDQANARQGGHDYAMLSQSQASVDSLLLLTKKESPFAQQLAQDYAASYTIYKSQSHQARLNLMKRNLLQEMQRFPAVAGQPAPKLLFKFGAYHLARGLSPIGWGEFYDVGNLVQNLADAQNQKSLHLYVTGKQGTAASASNPNFPTKNIHSYTAADNQALQPLLELVAGPAWSAIDLRPARRALTTGQLQVANQALQRIILGYDYVVLIPETTASRAI